MDDLPALLADAGNRARLQSHVEGGPAAGLLRSLKLKLLSNCNLKCEMCRYWRITKQGLSKEVIFRTLAGAARLGCRKVHLSGGEVTLHKDLPASIAHGASLGMRVNLTSNGVLMTKDRAREWIACGLHAASFSLDGSKAKTHDSLRGVPGAFKRTVRGIRILRREVERAGAKLRVRVNSVLSQRTLFELPQLIAMAGEWGCIDVVPMPIDGTFARPTTEEIARFNAECVPEIAALRKKYGMPMDSLRLYPFGRTPAELAASAQGNYSFGHYRQNLCFAPWLHAFVSHTGDVFACCMTREKMTPLGNIKQQSIEEIFVGPEYEAFRARMRVDRLPACIHCDQFLPENRLVSAHLELRPVAPLPALSISSLPIVELAR